MSKLIGVIENSWFIGIVGGIISGLIVYFITSYFLERKKKIDHKNNITAANRAVFEIVRPYIANSGLPDKSKLNAIMNSIARTYGIERNEMSSISAIYEDLIVEFMSNLYIPDEVKNKNIDMLLQNIQDLKSTVSENVEKSKGDVLVHTSAKEHFSKVSAILGVSISMISFVIGVIGNFASKSSFSIIVCGICILITIIAVIFAIVQWIKVRHATSLERKINRRLYDKYYMRSVNHGTPINESFGKEFRFVDYFEDSKYE